MVIYGLCACQLFPVFPPPGFLVCEHVLCAIPLFGSYVHVEVKALIIWDLDDSDSRFLHMGSTLVPTTPRLCSLTGLRAQLRTLSV